MFKFLEKRKLFFVYLPLLIYWSILFILTSIPINKLPEIGLSDKIEHFGAYLVLSFLLNLAFRFQNKIKLFSERPNLFSFLFAFIYGVFDEIHQAFIPGRDCDLFDLTADTIGAILGLIIILFLSKIENKKLPTGVGTN
ncbi:MAG: hypothetical protein STSR0008_11030 [Ignavibacterium sp.]